MAQIRPVDSHLLADGIRDERDHCRQPAAFGMRGIMTEPQRARLGEARKRTAGQIDVGESAGGRTAAVPHVQPRRLPPRAGRLRLSVIRLLALRQSIATRHAPHRVDQIIMGASAGGEHLNRATLPATQRERAVVGTHWARAAERSNGASQVQTAGKVRKRHHRVRSICRSFARTMRSRRRAQSASMALGSRAGQLG